MKYAVIVLRNMKNPIASVDYQAVTDALLGGGVFLDEVVLLPYDAPSAVFSTLGRLSEECDGALVVCDRVLLSSARDGVARAAGQAFTEEYLLETEKCLFGVLPEGEEGARLVKNETVPRIDRRRKNRYERVVVCAVAAPAELIVKAVENGTQAAEGRCELHATEKYGCVRVEIIYDRETPKMIADEVVRTVASTLGEFVYAIDDVSIEKRLFECLKLQRRRISTAESFTAGGVGQAIVSNAGASEVFFEGLNTYANGSKQLRLGVQEETLRAKGAVSDETAYEMARGLLAQGNCDIAVATTGIAGPHADGSDKPVGLCFIAVGTNERIRVYRYMLAGDRETVTRTATNFALYLAYKELNQPSLPDVL